MYKYANLDKITRKLRVRLKITQGGLPSIYNTEQLAKIAVDEDLVNDIIIEVEDYVDSYLSLIYKLPLRNRHVILEKCVEGLVIAELLEVHSFSGSEANDPSGFGLKNKQESLAIIKALTFSLNIPIPGLMETSKDRYHTVSLILPNEEFVTSREKVPTNSDTLVFSISDFPADQFILPDFGIESERYWRF